jgi:hypothetical protein
MSGNKIRNPQEAAPLAALTANWLKNIAPEFFNENSGITGSIEMNSSGLEEGEFKFLPVLHMDQNRVASPLSAT